MNAVDTNVLLYRVDQNEPVKQTKTLALIQRLAPSTPSTLLLWQVLGEFANQLRKWQNAGRVTRGEVVNHLNFARGLLPLVMPTPNVFDLALDLSGRFSLSHWDSMLLGACKEAGVTTLYSEDMGATTYDGVQVINPFV